MTPPARWTPDELRHLPSRPDLLARLGELRGKALGCWCAPLACHGDVLAGAAAEDGALRRGQRRLPDADRVLGTIALEASAVDGNRGGGYTVAGRIHSLDRIKEGMAGGHSIDSTDAIADHEAH